MRNLYLIFVFLVLLGTGNSSSSPQKTKCVNILYNRVSNWLSKSQYENILNDFEPHFYAEEPPETVGSKAVGIIMGRLSFSQMLQVAAFGSKLLGKLNQYIDTTMTVLGNNLYPFFLQLNKVTHVYKEKGVAKDPTVTRGYVKIAQFATPKRLNTIFCRARPAFGPDWPTIYSFVTDSKILKFSLYPCTIP
ncbi:hypothetical protein FO519_001009 [Halicephalobus sp. NKZ332]|nr:hypothetical protein FO519_001009 [Halicephalobus sp. NKZ332]